MTYIIAIEGPSGSGKSTTAQTIKLLLEKYKFKVDTINIDRFYRSKVTSKVTSTNYDIPDAFDTKLLFETIRQVKEKKEVNLPKYSYIDHCRLTETDYLESNLDVVILEGILVYWWPELRKYIDLPVYIDTKQEDCLIRRIKRDTDVRGRTIDEVFNQYIKTVKPAFEIYIQPQKKIISELGIVIVSNSVNGITNVVARVLFDLTTKVDH
jgi:uridine kinase